MVSITFLFYCVLGIIALVILATVIVTIIFKIQDRIIARPRPSIFLGKLDDSKSNDDINEAVEHLHLVNSFIDKE